MAEPAPPTNVPARAGLAGALRKIPSWGWVIAGGAVLGIGYASYRDRRTPEAAGPPAGEADLAAGLESYDLATQPSPGGAYYPIPPSAGESAETVGAIGQTALETVIGGITGIVEGIPSIIDAARPPTPETVLPQAGPPPPASPAPVAPAPATPAAPPSVTIAGRRFVGAYRYQEVASPRTAGRDFNVYYHKPHKDERWRLKPNGSWSKVAEGHFGG